MLYHPAVKTAATCSSSYDKVFLPEIQMLHEKPVETPKTTRKPTKFTDCNKKSLGTV